MRYRHCYLNGVMQSCDLHQQVKLGCCVSMSKSLVHDGIAVLCVFPYHAIYGGLQEMQAAYGLELGISAGTTQPSAAPGQLIAASAAHTLPNALRSSAAGQRTANPAAHILPKSWAGDDPGHETIGSAAQTLPNAGAAVLFRHPVQTPVQAQDQGQDFRMAQQQLVSSVGAPAEKDLPAAQKSGNSMDRARQGAAKASHSARNRAVGPRADSSHSSHDGANCVSVVYDSGSGKSSSSSGKSWQKNGAGSERSSALLQHTHASGTTATDHPPVKQQQSYAVGRSGMTATERTLIEQQQSHAVGRSRVGASKHSSAPQQIRHAPARSELHPSERSSAPQQHSHAVARSGINSKSRLGEGIRHTGKGPNRAVASGQKRHALGELEPQRVKHSQKELLAWTQCTDDSDDFA